MRTALATLILAAGLVSVAQAQDTPPAPPAMAPAAPAAPAATPTPEAPAPAAEAPPLLPTTGDGAVLISVIDKLCVPLVRGGNLDALAKATPGMKINRRDGSWTMPLGGDQRGGRGGREDGQRDDGRRGDRGDARQYVLTIYASGSNKDVCRGEIHYAIGETDPLVKALVVYSFLHKPELILQANYVQTTGDGIKRVQRSWEHLEPNAIQAVNFTTLSKPDDTPTAKAYQVAEFYYQERKLP